jgi:hypothetical protein
MKSIHKKRLLKLAKHLESGKLAHKKFNFGVWNGDQSGDQLYVNGCGYCGCAIGECPAVFKRDWMFRGGMPRLRNASAAPLATKNWLGEFTRDWPRDSAVAWFGINQYELDHLFLPKQQKPEAYGGKRLKDTASPAQVARNIRAFVAVKEKAAA